MFKNVIVGVDDGQGGHDALALARVLRDPDGKLIPANVHPSSQLHRLAEELDADLLVVGSSDRGLFGRVLVADDTTAAVNGAPCAVAIAPLGYDAESTVAREIGVAFNDSPESQDALAVARQIATATGAKLSACHVVSMPFARIASVLDDIRYLVDDAADQIAALGDVEPHAEYGDTGEELATYSASVDLLVVGSRGYGPLGRLVHGSTTTQLVRNARCPLLILTRGSREHEQRTGLSFVPSATA